MKPDPDIEQGHRSKFGRKLGSSEQSYNAHQSQENSLEQRARKELSCLSRVGTEKEEGQQQQQRPKISDQEEAMSENETAEQGEALMGGSGAATRPLWLYASNAHVWQKVAGVSGMAALALGTYGAHVFKPENPAYKEVWQTANLYHLVHTAALLGAPLTKRPHIFGGLLTFGIVFFSGSCYTTALMESRDWALPAPFGGFGFICAWASLLF